MKKYRIGIDVGGTDVKIGLVNKDGNIEKTVKIPTQASMGYEYTLSNIKEALESMLNEAKVNIQDVEGIGFGFPGQVDYKSGNVINLPNMPGWKNIPVAQIIEKEFNVPVRVDNDVNCAALGELKYGAGKGAEDIVCLTVGTGIGSGIIANGKLIRGASNLAGEIGHMKTQLEDGPLCGCGDQGCLEAVISGPSIIAMAKSYVEGGKSVGFCPDKDCKITPQTISEAGDMGDVVALKIYEIMGRKLGTALASVVNLLNPQKIIIGGGVAGAGDKFFNPIKKAIKERAMSVSAQAADVVAAQLGNKAGIIGASLLIEG